MTHAMPGRARYHAAIAVSIGAIAALSGCANRYDEPNGSAAASASASAQQTVQLALEGAWIPAPPGGGAGEEHVPIFGELVNRGAESVVLESMASDVSRTVQYFIAVDDKPDMLKRVDTGDIELGPNESLELTPDGNMLMLVEVEQELLAGDTVMVTITPAEGGALVIPVLVKPLPSESAEPSGGSDQGENDEGKK